MKRVFYKCLPYGVSCVAGAGFYVLGLFMDGDFKNLLMNISAALFAIPVILFFYEIIKSLSESKLTKEIFEYGKMQVDREALGITHQLMKIVYPLDKVDFTFKGIQEFLALSKEEVRNILAKNEYFGFQVFRSWDVYERNLESVLMNSYIIQKLDNDQIIAIIKVLKNVRSMDASQKIANMFSPTGKKKAEYKLVKGDTINSRNDKFPDRYLLLKHLVDDKFLVVDFPDIPKYNEAKAFYTYELNPAGLEFFAETIFDLITEVNEWVSITGDEFLIDTKMFRLGYGIMQA